MLNKISARGEFGRALLLLRRKPLRAEAYRHAAIARDRRLQDILLQKIPAPVGPAIDRVAYKRVPGLDRVRLPSAETYAALSAAAASDPFAALAVLLAPPPLGVPAGVLARKIDAAATRAILRVAEWRDPKAAFQRRVTTTLAHLRADSAKSRR